MVHIAEWKLSAMDYIRMIGMALLFTMSYSIAKWLTLGLAKLFKVEHLKKYAVYLWGLAAVIIPFFAVDFYVYTIPTIDQKVLAVSLVLLLANIFFARYSGYRIDGKWNTFNFIVVYPIVEEVIFRGLVLPTTSGLINEMIVEIAYLPVTFAVVITASLFAVAHLQYYKLNKASMIYMFWAFIGGIFLGAVTEYTQSIIFSIILHFAFNLMAVYYYRRNKS